MTKPFDLDRACLEALARVLQHIEKSTTRAHLETREAFLQAHSDLAVRHIYYQISGPFVQEMAAAFQGIFDDAIGGGTTTDPHAGRTWT